MRVIVVTPTYGNRWQLLRQTLECALREGADQAFIVDDHSDLDIAPMAEREFPAKTKTVRFEKNRGSAVAYHRGIQQALAENAEYLLLLDDDNRVCPETILKLCAVYRALAVQKPLDSFCLMAMRDGRGDVDRPGGGIPVSANAFMQFEICELPEKLHRRLLGPSFRLLTDSGLSRGSLLARKVAPFGGLFFHRSLIERFGYPKEELVLYQDDIEFTYRITSNGGEIFLVPDAKIEDLEPSWNLGEIGSNSLERWLQMGSDKQVFYTARNMTYFETHCRTYSWRRYVNKAIYLMLLWSWALMRGKLARFRLILDAVNDGEAGFLGIKPSLPPSA